MKTKIDNLTITGFRGVRNTINLPLKGKSAIIYGPNGTGKSSISDAIEWFYTNSVSHLSDSETDLKEALRNAYLSPNETSTVSIAFQNSSLNGSKELAYEKNKLIAKLGPSTASQSSDLTVLSEFLTSSQNENLLLRYQHLRGFIDQTKTEKLKYLSDIIGYSELTKTKDVLKKVFNGLKSEIKNQNFEAQINNEKQNLIDKIGAAVSQESQLFEEINKLLGAFNPGISINSFEDIDKVLELLKKSANSGLIAELQFLENILRGLHILQINAPEINIEYEKYIAEFNKIAADTLSVLQTFLGKFLKTGEEVLTKEVHKEDTCPFCLQPKNLNDLKSEIQKRLQEIEKSTEQLESFDKAKKLVENVINQMVNKLNVLQSYSPVNQPSYQNISKAFQVIGKKLNAYTEAVKIKVLTGIKPPAPEDLKITPADFSVIDEINERIKQIKTVLDNDKTSDLYARILSAKESFLKIKRFEKEKKKLEHQKNSMEIIHNEFIKRQKEALQNFIDTFSWRINYFYQLMNPGEQFSEIKVVTMGDEDELKGITLEYQFNNQRVSPPQKYFSESHLNCIGLSFFLASVLAFNKENKFIVLDDVISGFDTEHRQRFADLLRKEFSDFQLILLTHETDWFEYVKNKVKHGNWIIGKTQWNQDTGTTLEIIAEDEWV